MKVPAMTALRMLRLLVLAGACSVLHLPSFADTFTLAGDTTGAPTFQRPVEDLSGLSAIGTAVPYDVWTFSAAVSGTYTFLTSGSFDTFALLYATPFSPAASLLHALVANDDLALTPFTVSGFQFDLVAGTRYAYVLTGFDNDEFGTFSSSITEPAVVASVPEPGAWALMVLGMAAVSALRRRRSAALAAGMGARS